MHRNFGYRVGRHSIVSGGTLFAATIGSAALLILIAGAAFRAQSAPPPQSLSVWDGMYTTEQANRGSAIFQKECSKCHGQQLEGIAEAPSLAGGGFLSQWNGLSLGDLFERIRNTMPQDDPGKLSGQQYADVLAFLLRANDFPAGQTQVGTQAEMLKQIQIDQFNPHPEPTPAPAGNKAAGNVDKGKELFSSVGCANCHGSAAKGGAPQLSSPKLTLDEFIKYVRQPSGKMPAIAPEKATDAQLGDIYSFLKSDSAASEKKMQ